MIYIFVLFLCLIALCGVLLSYYAYLKLKNEYDFLYSKYDSAKNSTIQLKKQEELYKKEIEQLKTENEILKSEKKIAQKAPVKSVEDLPKTEKITKKKTTTRKTTKK